MRPNGKAFIAFFILGLLLWVVIRLMHFNGLYGQDSYEYLRYAKDIHAGVLSATPASDFPPLYPALGALLGFAFDIALALQLISVFSFVLTLWVAYEVTRLIFPASKYAHIFLALFGFLSPYYMRSSVSVMSDSLACLLLTCAIFYAVCVFQHMTIRYFLFVVLFAALAVLTRFSASVPLSILILLLSIMVIREGQTKLFLRMVLILSISAFLLIFYGKMFLLKGLSHSLLKGFSLFNLFHSSFSASDGQMAYSLPNWCNLFFPLIHPGFIFIGIALLFFLRKDIITRGEIILCLIPAIAYWIFLGMLPVQNVRLQILTFPLLLIVYQPAFDNHMGEVKQKQILLIAMAVCQLPLIFLSMKAILQMNRVERQIASYLKPLQGKYQYVYELGSSGVIQAYDIHITPVSLYGDTIFSVKDSALLLLQTETFEKQWQGKLPAKNLEFIQAHAFLEKLKTFDDKWNLYTLHHR